MRAHGASPGSQKKTVPERPTAATPASRAANGSSFIDCPVCGTSGAERVWC